MHIVSEGDTLWDIAEKYNIELAYLIKINSLNKNAYLQLGQQLTIGNKNIHRNIESKNEQSFIQLNREIIYIKYQIFLMYL